MPIPPVREARRGAIPSVRNAGRKHAPSGPTSRTLSSSARVFASARRVRRSHEALRASIVSGALPLVQADSRASLSGCAHAGVSSQASSHVAPSRNAQAVQERDSHELATASASRTRGIAAPHASPAEARSQVRAASISSSDCLARARIRRHETMPAAHASIPSRAQTLPTNAPVQKCQGEAPSARADAMPTRGRAARTRADMRGPAEATRRASSTTCASSTLSPMASRMSARGAPRPWLNRQARAMDAAADLAAPASGDRACNGTLQRGGSHAHSSRIVG